MSELNTKKRALTLVDEWETRLEELEIWEPEDFDFVRALLASRPEVTEEWVEKVVHGMMGEGFSYDFRKGWFMKMLREAGVQVKEGK